MKLLIRISILTLCLIGAILVITPSFLDNAALRFQIEKDLSSKFKADLRINEGAHILFLPSPRIIFNHVSVNNLRKGDRLVSLFVKKATIKFSFTSLLTGHLKPSALVIKSPVLEITDIESEKVIKRIGIDESKKPPRNPRKADSLAMIEKMFDIDYGGADEFRFKDVYKTSISKGKLIKRNLDSEVDFEFQDVVFDVINNIKEQFFTLEGFFIANNVPTTINIVANTNEGADSKFMINSPILSTELIGKFSRSDINSLNTSNFNGKIKAEIADLQGVFKSYFTNSSLVNEEIATPQPIKVNAVVNGDGGAMVVDDLTIDSQLIKGTGRVEVNLASAKKVVAVNLLLDVLNLDGLWPAGIIDKNKVVLQAQAQRDAQNEKENQPDAGKEEQAATQEEEVGGSMLDNIDLTADIKVKEVIYLEEKLRDANLRLVKSETGNLSLNPLFFKTPGEGALKVIGDFNQEGKVLKFVGKSELSGKSLKRFLSWVKMRSKNLKGDNLNNYDVVSDVEFSSGILKLKNLQAGLNEKQDFVTGSLSVNLAKRSTRIFGDFVINEFNFEDYFLDLDEGEYLKEGSLLNKFIWLNTIAHNTDLRLNFKKLAYKDSILEDQFLKVSFGQGYFKISNLEIKAEDIDLKGFVSIDITSSPRIDVGLTLDKLRYGNQNAEKSRFFSQFFTLPSIADFNGSIDIDAKNMMIDGVEISDVSMGGEVDKGIWQLMESKMNIYGGQLVYNGSILLKTAKTINGSFELANIDNRQFLQSILNMDNISGVSNISGVINGVGRSRNEFFKNLDLQAQFVSGNIVVGGFGINDLMKKMLSPRTNRVALSKPLKLLLNKNAKALFKDAKGAVDIRRNNTSNKFRVESSIVGINGITTGSIDLNDKLLNGLSQFVFLSGTREKQIPIKLAVSYGGTAGKLTKEANIDQVNQYLNAVYGIRNAQPATTPKVEETKAEEASQTPDSSSSPNPTQ
ncbi:MAG: AsmA family protein, partial [Proteobacteria bacterium]|nr:AsmA family protein [Pseudomonadota bacterium]